jgi:hypothetical protein
MWDLRMTSSSDSCCTSILVGHHDDDADDVPAGLAIPRWSWERLPITTSEARAPVESE